MSRIFLLKNTSQVRKIGTKISLKENTLERNPISLEQQLSHIFLQSEQIYLPIQQVSNLTSLFSKQI